jgi:hypothetical protein
VDKASSIAATRRDASGRTSAALCCLGMRRPFD